MFIFLGGGERRPPFFKREYFLQWISSLNLTTSLILRIGTRRYFFVQLFSVTYVFSSRRVVSSPPELLPCPISRFPYFHSFRFFHPLLSKGMSGVCRSFLHVTRIFLGASCTFTSRIRGATCKKQ